MSPSTHTLLVAIVDRTEETGGPVTVRELATTIDDSGPVRSEEVPGIPDALLEQTVDCHTTTSESSVRGLERGFTVRTDLHQSRRGPL
jgi:hypothetical protein